MTIILCRWFSSFSFIFTSSPLETSLPQSGKLLSSTLHWISFSSAMHILIETGFSFFPMLHEVWLPFLLILHKLYTSNWVLPQYLFPLYALELVLQNKVVPSTEILLSLGVSYRCWRSVLFHFPVMYLKEANLHMNASMKQINKNLFLWISEVEYSFPECFYF